MTTDTLAKSLYDTDVVTWADQQAEALRDLARLNPHGGNAIDWENVIEEIESVGRGEWRSVESQMGNVLTHVLKGFCDPDSLSIRKWRAETRGFLTQIRNFYRGSMAAKFNIDEIWADAFRQATGELTDYHISVPPGIPVRCPFSIDDLLDEEASYDNFVKRLFDVVDNRKP